MPFDLFICYRRGPSALLARQLYDHLHDSFGETVFIDHERLRAGASWRQQVDSVIRDCRAVVVLLAAGWLAELERRRREGEPDEVLRELQGAMRAGVPVIPLYAEGTASPKAEDHARLAACSVLAPVVRVLADAQAMRWWAASSGADLAKLDEELARFLPRFPERLRERCSGQLQKRCGEGTQIPWSRKFKGLASALPRDGLAAEIDRKRSADPWLTVLHAEEGMGKTYALGQLLLRQDARTVLLVDAADPIWRSGFVNGVEAFLLQSDLATPAERELALGQPLCIAIDGLNEALFDQQNPWPKLLQEALRLPSAGSPWRLIVTLRSAVWQRWRKALAWELQDARLAEVELPLLDDDECEDLAQRLGFPWRSCSEEVRAQLRKPRMLVAAARLKPADLEGWELSDGLLTLLDLQQQSGMAGQRLSFEDYCATLSAAGKRHLTPTGLRRQDLRDLFDGDSDGEFEQTLAELVDRGLIDRSSRQLSIRKDVAALGVALHLIEILQSSPLELEALTDRIEQTLAERQPDFIAQCLKQAIGAQLRTRLLAERDGRDAAPRPADPILAALFLAWHDRYNRHAVGGLPWPRWLLPEFIQLTEAGRLPDAAEWLTNALQWRPPPPAEEALLLRRFDEAWFLSVDVSDSRAEHVAERAAMFAEARQQLPQLRDLRSTKLQRIALDVAIRQRLDPRERPLFGLCVAVAVQPSQGWDRLIQWIQVAHVDCGPLMARLWEGVDAAGFSPELRMQMVHLIHQLWPTAECRERLGPPVPAVWPQAWPAPALPDPRDTSAPDPARLAVACRRAQDDPAAVASGDMAMLAIWAPAPFATLLTRMVQHAADPAQPLHFLPARLEPYTPVLTPRQALALRRRVSRATDNAQHQLDALSAASWWALPEPRRTASVLRHLRVIDLRASTLWQAPLSPSLAARLVERLLRDPAAAWTGRIILWLCVALDHRNGWSCRQSREAAVRGGLRRVLPLLLQKPETTSLFTQKWLLFLACALGLEAEAAGLIPEDWSYTPVYEADAHQGLNELRSRVLARSGLLTTAAVQQRCHIDHWPASLASEREQQSIQRTRHHLLQELPQFLDPQQIAKAVAADPELVPAVIATGDGHRAEVLAAAIEADSTTHWLPLLRLTLPRRSFRHRINGLYQNYVVLFKTPDSAAVRELWDQALALIEHDTDLLDLIVTAHTGHGAAWLREHARINPQALPQAWLRAATIACFIGATDEIPHIEALRDQSSGWIAHGLQQALARSHTDRQARGWYQRFRNATTWPEACGSWELHLEAIDLRHRLWPPETQPPHLEDATRYEFDFQTERQQAAQRNSVKYRKTRFGLTISA
ncbi:MAG: toll/interleukin-1 receptor domain-containing protein [Xanthomonadales bacterium]|jgi:hypothetical protein|nr:toll/interleukin-1 receptor domain-containing protein [Xanthomonadales bacterium]